MTSSSSPILPSDVRYNEHFLKWIKDLVEADTMAILFPRKCRVCGNSIANLVEYCCSTKPRAHGFEDCRGLNDDPFMMLYRHCTCGNTLVLSITEKAFPGLNSFWKMLQDEAEDSNRSLKEVVADFARQFESYVLSLNDSCEAPME